MKKLSIPFLSLLLLCGAGLMGTAETPAKEHHLYTLDVEGVINPVVAAYIKEGLKRAGESNAAGVLIQLDTPGGLLDATRAIVQDILNAKLPVVVFVSPRGARAASAGVFITLSADVAAMAPETHLGAAHPVSIGGGSPLPRGPSPQPQSDGKKEGKEGDQKQKAPGSVMEEKAVSDAAAYARTLATSKGRNADWAEAAVRESKSLTAEEALEKNVVDVVAKDIPDLLEKIEGREIIKNDIKYVIHFKGIEKQPFEMNWMRRFLQIVAHPNVAYLLLTLGFYALVYEFASPGGGIGAVVGIICLVLAFFSLQVLPISYAGLALLITGIVLMAADIFIPSGGFLTIGGLVCFALGSFMLIDSPAPYLRVSLEIIVGTVLSTGAFFVFAVKKIFEARKRKPVTGVAGLVGMLGKVKGDGMVYVRGEYWSVESDDRLKKGDKVQIEEVNGNRLRVKKI